MLKYKNQAWLLWSFLFISVCAASVVYLIKDETSVGIEKQAMHNAVSNTNLEKKNVSETKKDSLAKTSVKEKQAPVSSFVWRDNARQIYHYYLTANVNINTAVVQDTAEWLNAQLDLTGLLNMRVFGRDGDKIYVGFQLSNLKTEQNKQRLPILENLYQRFFVAIFNPQGEILGFHFPAYMTAEADQNSMMEVIRSIQFVFPKNDDNTKSVDKWETHEVNSTGTYLAEYQRKSDIFYKQKKLYTEVSPQTQKDWQGLKISAEIINSESHANISPQKSWLLTFKGDDTFKMNTGFGKLAKVIHKVELDLDDEIATDPTLDIWSASNDYTKVLLALANMKTMPLPAGWAELEKAKLREELANVSLENLVNELHQSLDATTNLHTQLDYIQSIRQYLEAYPERSYELAALLKDKPLDANTTSAVIHALTNVGHFEAQQVLAELIVEGSTVNKDVMEQAIIASGTLNNPDPLISEALWVNVKTSDAHLDTALLALGSNSYHFNEQGNYASAEQLQTDLSLYLQTNDTVFGKTLALKALNNAGDKEIFDIVTPYLTEESSHIRAAAHQVLGNLDDVQSQEILIKSLAEDKSSNVRRTALQSLRRRPDQHDDAVIAPMATILEKESDVRIQTDIIEFLGEQRPYHPNAEVILKEQLQKDLPREVRKQVYTALYREQQQ